MFTKTLKPCAAHFAKSLHSSQHSYATISSPDSSFASSIWPTTPYPTPYQILAMDPMSQKYSKARFAELVKLYHPDRSASIDPRCAHLTKAARLERYHMVIAAHDILSNPERRLAYDRYGAGWSRFTMPIPHPAQRPSTAGQSQSYGGSHRGYDPYSARMNATWEDWEHWRASREDRADDHESQGPGEPRFMPHSMFAGLVFFASITAGVAQHRSANTIARQRNAFRDESHMNAMREYELRQRNKRSRSKDERIESFSKSRDSNSPVQQSMAR